VFEDFAFGFSHSGLADCSRSLPLVFISRLGGAFEEFADGFLIVAWRSI
jgi:hypothetical protein